MSCASPAFTYTSSDKRIVKVSKKGKLTAVKVGTTTISVAAGKGLSNTCTVTDASGKVMMSASEAGKFTIAVKKEGTAAITARAFNDKSAKYTVT